MNYIIHIIVILEIYILLAFSANQKVGMSGLLSLSIAVFYGIGAYAVGVFTVKFLFGYWLSLILALCCSILFAFIFNYIASKVRNLYFSLATLAIQIIFFSVIYNWIPVTNGPYGISGINNPHFFTSDINTPLEFALFGGSWVIVILVFYMWFLRTPFSRLIKATRDDQIAVVSFGKNPNYYKSTSIIISAIIATIAGSIYATYTTYIDPSSFTIDESILILSIVLIGGSGSLIGPISGATIYILLPEILKYLDLPDSIAANLRMILFGLLLVLIIRLRPKGLFGKYSIQ